MKIQDFAEKINFKKINNCYYYTKDGFTFSLKEYETFIKIKSFYVSINEEFKKEDLNTFTKTAFDNVCYVTTNESKNDTLIITLPTSMNVNEGFINSCINIINAITKKLIELNYTPKTRCLHCHKEAELNSYIDEYIPLHDECKEEIKKELEQKIEKQNKEKYRYLLNFIYSLLISFVGCMINYLIVYKFNSIITPLLLLVTFGAFFGLHLSKAKNDKLSSLITFIVSINFVVLFNVLAFTHLSKVNELSFNNYFNENTWYVIRKVLFSILFIFGGMRIYKMFFSKYHTNFDKIIKNI